MASLPIAGLITSDLCQAQVSSDPTLSTQVTLEGRNFSITGGTQAGDNLFHSFEQFSLLRGWSAFFDHALSIQNIIARVTGGSVSNINGLIKTNDDANLFLINPSGIIFGRGARLNIGGSFIASTAEQIKFADSSTFNAKNVQAQPLLTLSAPVGLQFGNVPKGVIANEGSLLRVDPKKTIALVGGEISLQGSIFSAPEGRIELGSVASDSFVSLIPVNNRWTLGFEGTQNYQDIHISNGTALNVGNPFITKKLGLGDIQLQGRNISIIDNSIIGGTNNSSSGGGAIIIKSSESVNIIDSDLNSRTISTGAAGDVLIETKRLTISSSGSSEQQPGIFASTGSIGRLAKNNNLGQGGQIIVNASEFIDIKNGIVSSKTFGTGNAGGIQISTKQLILRDGGQISSTTENKGDGGTININTSGSINISGTVNLGDNELIPSGIFAQTLRKETSGNGGNVVVTTKSLVVNAGGTISVSSDQDSMGEAGRLDIDALSIEVSGADSSIQAEGKDFQTAGNLNIQTDTLTVQAGASISVSSKGQAGDLIISANEIYLDNGSLTAETGASGPEGSGNIQLQNVKFLQLSNGSEISAEATGTANGGNIFIDAADGFVVGVPGGDSTIKASAGRGQGGNITITAKGIYGFAEGKEVMGNGINEIDASSDYGPSGTVQLNTPDVDPSQTIVELPGGLVDASGLIIQRCSEPAAKTAQQQQESGFIITGRGGLPPNPSESLSSDASLVGLVAPVKPSATSSHSVEPKTIAQTPLKPIVEAQGWVVDTDGAIVLTAQVPTPTSHPVGLTQGSCFTP
jgi:filamentous hemagglutinin family protein